MNLNPEAMIPTKSKKRVLFLCNENSCRSQMAEGFLKALAPGTFEAYSAGTVATFVNPLAQAVMAEEGVDIARQRSKSISDFEGWEFDYVITVCGESQSKTCPAFTGAVGKREAWDIEDPAAVRGRDSEIVDAFRESRDEIRERVRGLIEENT